MTLYAATSPNQKEQTGSQYKMVYAAYIVNVI